MTFNRPRWMAAALLAIFTLTAVPQHSDAAQRKKPAATKKKAPAKKAPAKKKSVKKAAAPAGPVAVGNTLEERLGSLMESSISRGSTASLQVVDVATGRVVGQKNADLPIAPASNIKLFTTAAALDLLKPDYEFRTLVAMRGATDPNGTLRGDVKITGGGDPTIGGRFHDGRAAAVIEQWASDLKRAGIKTIAGDLIFEHGFFDTEYVHPSWPEDQLVNWYEAPISSLSMQEGCVLVRVLPGRAGGPAVVQLEPANSYITVENSCKTRGRNSVFVTRVRNTNRIIVRGTIAPRSGPVEVYVAVFNPIHYFANVAHQTLLRNGINVQGNVRLIAKDPRTDWQAVTDHRTPLSIAIFVINKKSQNQYAEQLLKTIGAEVKKDGSFAGGSAVVEEWLTTRVGVPANQYEQIDGSGMSRLNRASASAFNDMLRYMWHTPYRGDFVSSMPYSGERDSRLRRRLNTPGYARQVYAKTGYISGVIGLSGYVHAKSGKIYAFSFLFNRYTSGTWGVYSLQNAMLKEIIDHG